MVNKANTYLVLNYCSSPVAVATRDGSYIIAGGTLDAPGSYPFSLDEIIQINSSSPIFKVGYLFFEEQYEADIYEALRIRDWKEILREPDVEDAILHPTIAKLQKIIDIDSDLYFERIYGIYIGLKNANYPIPGNSKTVIETRHKEMKNGKRKSEIILQRKETPADNPEVTALKKELEELKKMLSAKQETEKETPVKEKAAPAKKPTARKKTTKK